MEINKKSGFKIAITCIVLVAVFMFSSVALANTKNTGDFNGTFLGSEDYGWFALNIQPDGAISGTGGSTVRDVNLYFKGTCQPDGKLQFTSHDRRIVAIHGLY